MVDIDTVIDAIKVKMNGRTRHDGQLPFYDELLVAEIERLRVALEPFADVDSEGEEDYPDDTKATVSVGRSSYYGLTLGDFRRARAAWSPESDTDGKRDR